MSHHQNDLFLFIQKNNNYKNLLTKIKIVQTENIDYYIPLKMSIHVTFDSV